MTPWAETLLSVAVISLVSLVGLLTVPFHVLRRHGLLFALIALAAGTLVGNAFFHQLPETVEIWGEFSVLVGSLVVGGFLLFYLLEAGLRWGHAHGEAHHAPHDHYSSASAQAPPVHPPGGESVGARIQAFGFLNLIGDAMHNFLDGIVIAAAFLVDTTTGIATAVAVAIHELPQEFGDFGVLLRAGFSPFQAALFNLVSALFAVGGAVLLLSLPFEPETLEKFALPLVAGGFLYIAAADLIPELHHHTRGRFIPVVLGLFVLGLALMAGLTLLE